MDKREIFKIANLKEIQNEFNLPQIFCYDYCVGYDQCVYLLLSRQPQRTQYANTLHFKKKEYYAVKLNMDWKKQKVTKKELYPLGKIPYELEFLRPLADCFLLLGSKTEKIDKESHIMYEDDLLLVENASLLLSQKDCSQEEEEISLELDEKSREKNGILLDKNGTVITKYAFKKDILDCQTSSDGQILLEVERKMTPEIFCKIADSYFFHKGEEEKDMENYQHMYYVEAYDIEGNYKGEIEFPDACVYGLGGEESIAVSEMKEKVMISIKNPRWARYREYRYDTNKKLLTDEKLVQMEYQGKYVKNVPNKVWGSKMLFRLDEETIGGHFFREDNRVEVIDPKENREVFPVIDIEELKQSYHMQEYHMADYYVGYDQKIYMLFCNQVPRVYKGKIHKLSENREYIAVALELDWIKGKVIDTQLFSLGRQDYYFHTIRPLQDNFLLLGWKIQGRKEKKNGVLIDKNGKILHKYYFGSGIGKCCTTKEGVIYTGHDDDTLYDDPIAKVAVNAWNEQGKRLWHNRSFFCESMSLGENGMLWYCDEFLRLFGTDLRNLVEVRENGCAGGFSISVDGKGFIFEGGGEDKGSYYEYEYDSQEGRLKHERQICFRYGENNLELESYEFCGSKMLFMTKEGKVLGYYYSMWQE